ncbi:MAG: hypothetical protein M3R24_23220 [Chloroflexota bacterium]|nr:hypothetical protein [Chloroflexota bacterium]
MSRMQASEIGNYLHSLVGLPLAAVNRAADMRVFEFGTLREVAGRTIADFALHIQCPWRLEQGSDIITGRTDLWEPAEPSTSIDWVTWDYDTNANLQDAKLNEVLAGDGVPTRITKNQTDGFLVEAVAMDAFRGITITFSGSYRLVVFPAGVRGEQWRLFQPNTEQPHLVCDNASVSLHSHAE